MEPRLFRNYYRHKRCSARWVDSWSCCCNDKCPSCHREIEPYKSVETAVYKRVERLIEAASQAKQTGDRSAYETSATRISELLGIKIPPHTAIEDTDPSTLFNSLASGAPL